MIKTEKNSYIHALILAAILVVAAVVRLIGIRFGLPMAYHNDEWVLVLATQQFFTGDYNPHIFLYPSFLMYIMHGVERIYFLFFSGREDLSTLYVLCRITVVLFALASIYITYLLARRLHDGRVGLLAAAMLCLSPLHVIHSHFATTDVPLAFFVVISFLFILRLPENGSRLNYALTGIFFGFAVSIKIPGAALIIPIIIAHTHRVVKEHNLPVAMLLKTDWRQWRKQIAVVISGGAGAILIYLLFHHFDYIAQKIMQVVHVELWDKYYDEIIPRAVAMAPKMALMTVLVVFLISYTAKIWRPEFSKILILIGAAITTFFLTTPYAILDYKTFLHDFFFQMVISQSSWSGMFAEQAPAYIRNFAYLWKDLGAIIMISALVGAAVYALSRNVKYWIILSFILVYYFYLGTWKLMFDRYMIPLLPLLVILAAFVPFYGYRQFMRSRWNKHRRARRAVMTVLTLLLVGALVRNADHVIRWDRYILKPSTRKVAYDWAIANLPREATVLREQYTPELELADYKVVNVNFTFNDSVDVDYVRRNAVDYIIVGSKLWTRKVQEDGILGEREAYKKIPKYATLVYHIKPSPEHPGPEIKIFKVNIEHTMHRSATDSVREQSNVERMRTFF